MLSGVSRLSRVALVSGVVLTASLLIGASAPIEPAPSPSTDEQIETLAELVEVEPSSELDGPVLTAGEVEGAGAGVPVIATAWPDQGTLDQQQPGDSVELVTIAATLTDSDGGFELVADPAAVAVLTGGGERVVNFDVTAANAGDEVALVATSATLSPEIAADETLEDALTDAVAIEADEPLTVDEVAGSSEVGEATTARGQASFATVALASADEYEPTDSADATLDYYKCGTTLIERLDKRPTIIGSTYSTSTAVRSQFILTRGGASSFGVGTSKSGAFGSWSANGTSTITSEDTDEFPVKVGKHGKIYKKYQNYGKYRNVLCDGDIGQLVTYSVRPIGNPYGSYEAASPVPSATRCVGYASKHTFSKGKAQYWSTGVTLEALIGFNASAQSGYSSQVRTVTYHSSGGTYTVCGTGNVPEQSNTGRLVAK